MLKLRSHRLLTPEEVALVVDDLRTRAERSVGFKQNLAIFRLSCCVGLRRGEISGLELRDLRLTGPAPYLKVRASVTKGVVNRHGVTVRRGRDVTLTTDQGTLDDLTMWYAYRYEQVGGDLTAPFVCRLKAPARGTRLDGKRIAERWTTALKALEDRRRELSIHTGRHTYCSIRALVGDPLTAIREAAGHSNIATTSIYLHAYENVGMRNVFDIKKD